MRIIHVTNNYYPYCAGVVASIDAIVHEQKKQGHEVVIITLNFLGDQHADPEYVIRIPSVMRFMYGVNHAAIPWRPGAFLRATFSSFKPDIVHVHHPFLLGKIAVRIARSMHIRTVFTHHTMYEQYVHYVPMPAFLMKPAVLHAVHQFCTKIDGIVVPSSGMRKRLDDEGIYGAMVIPSPLRPSYLTHALHVKQLHRPIHLLSVGRLVKEKNIKALLDLMVVLPDYYVLTLVGYGAYYEQLQEYAYHTLGLERQRVVFMYKPSPEVLQEQYHAAHFFLFSSTTDTQGIVLAEAMAHSLPVIALDGIGQRDCVVTGYNGYLVHNVEDMARALRAIECDENHYQALRRGACATARNYSAEVLGQRLIEYYHGIVAKELV